MIDYGVESKGRAKQEGFTPGEIYGFNDKDGNGKVRSIIWEPSNVDGMSNRMRVIHDNGPSATKRSVYFLCSLSKEDTRKLANENGNLYSGPEVYDFASQLPSFRRDTKETTTPEGHRFIEIFNEPINSSYFHITSGRKRPWHFNLKQRHLNKMFDAAITRNKGEMTVAMKTNGSTLKNIPI